MSRPLFKFAFFANSKAGGPAEFLSTSTGTLRPSRQDTMNLLLFPEVIRALTVSEYLFNAKPNTSNPTPRFAVEQKALPTARVRMALIAQSRLIAKLAADKRGLVPPCRAVATRQNMLVHIQAVWGKSISRHLISEFSGSVIHPSTLFKRRIHNPVQ